MPDCAQSLLLLPRLPTVRFSGCNPNLAHYDAACHSSVNNEILPTVVFLGAEKPGQTPSSALKRLLTFDQINDLSQETLAAMTGSVRVVVGRQMQKWKQDGTLANDRGQWSVDDLQALIKKAELQLEI